MSKPHYTAEQIRYRASSALDDLDCLEGRGKHDVASNMCRGDPWFAGTIMNKYGTRDLARLRTWAEGILRPRKPAPPPTVKTHWLNVYVTREGAWQAGGIYATRAEADAVAKSHRVDCIPVQLPSPVKPKKGRK